MPFKKKKTWVFVADGTRARIFVKGYKSLENATGQDYVSDNLQNREIAMDKPGRGFESANPTRHAYQPRTDWHQHHKQLFAKELCTILNEASENAEFDELVIICPAKILGEMRAHLGKQTLTRVTAEIPKDVTKFTDPELMHFLEREL